VGAETPAQKKKANANVFDQRIFQNIFAVFSL
jgi:hypothetical protein